MALMAASAICGSTVTGRDGESLGTITEIMLDCEGGGIAYVVLSHGGLMGLGEKLFAVPWSALHADAAAGSFRVEADSPALDAAGGIDKDAWPAEAAANWIR